MKENNYRIEILKIALEILKAEEKKLTTENILKVYHRLIAGMNMPTCFN